GGNVSSPQFLFGGTCSYEFSSELCLYCVSVCCGCIFKKLLKKSFVSNLQFWEEMMKKEQRLRGVNDMRWQVVPALAVACILVRTRGKIDKIYIQISAILFYALSFLGIFYFARKATNFLYGDFLYGRNCFIWFCLLAASIFYLPRFEKHTDLYSLCKSCLETGLHLFIFGLVSFFGFCTQSIDSIPTLLVGILIVIALCSMGILRYRLGGGRELDFRDVLLLLLLASIYYYFGYTICYIRTGVENPPSYIFTNIMILFAVLLLLLFITASMNLTVIIGAIINMVWILAHYFVYQFRGSIFVPNDIFSISTAATVVSGYQFYISKDIWRMCFFSLAIILVAANYKKVCVVKHRKIFSIVGTVTLSLFIAGWYQSDFISWMNLPYREYKQDQWYDSIGYTLGFIEVMKKNRIDKPDNYNVETIEELARQYSIAEDVTTELLPDIIVIMNEAFADIGDVGEIETNIDYMPFYHSLTTCSNTAVGRALVSVQGGNTCQSEYEFLTGNSIEFAPNVVPYVAEMRGDIYSLVSTLKSNGYYAKATHPYTATNWNRNVVYRYMQFDEMIFIEDYSGAEYIGGKVSDRAIYQKILTWLKEDAEEPQFVFAVTMQNHGGYSGQAIREGEEFPVTREGRTEPGEVEEYLSLIYESDRALEELIAEVDALKRPTIVVMFGDHFPTMTDDFVDSIVSAGNQQDDFISFQIQHATPYIVHANYAVDLSDIPEYLSVNYLAPNVLRACGLEMPAFYHYLLDMEKEIPALNAYGFLTEEGRWYQYSEEYPAEYYTKLNEYNILQYNARYKNAVPQMFAVQ
ncbi:MAG: LTA synthase family protein, partial [Lachnospiraceae bacterium]|nr:LTA synthase family protein [Lachnospiraceae bacterium]